MYDTELKVFKRVPFGKSHFANYFRLHPVQEISISDNFIILNVGRNKFRYEWKEITGARIITLNTTEPYGKWGSNRIRRLFVLRARDRSFKFDVSTWYGDFQGGYKLLEELRSHLDVKEEQRISLFRSKYRPITWVILSVAILSSGLVPVFFSIGLVICLTLIMSSLSVRTFDLKHEDNPIKFKTWWE